MKRLILISAVILATALPAFAADETPAPSKETSAAEELTAFGAAVCDSSLKGFKETLTILSLEFGLRLTMDENELKKSGMTLEESIKKNEEMIHALADDSSDKEIRPEKCTVKSSTPRDCKDIFARIAADGAFGMKVDEKRAAATAKAMKIDECGLVSINASAKGRTQIVDFAVGKLKGQWRILVGFTTPSKPETDEQQPDGTKPVEK